eukprot:COSAG02_NODE_19_length_53976_cov_37.338512_39_plen_190_part_00
MPPTHRPFARPPAAVPQGFNTVKLVFISVYVYFDYYVNFDWCRKVHSCSCSGTRLACTVLMRARAARLGKIFPRSRRALDTAEKSSREQQALLEYTRTACSTSTIPGVASIARSSVRDRSSDYMHAFSISDNTAIKAYPRAHMHRDSDLRVGMSAAPGYSGHMSKKTMWHMTHPQSRKTTFRNGSPKPL